MHRHVDRLAGARQRRDEVGTDLFRRGDRQPRVDAQDFDVGDRREASRDVGEAARRGCQRIATRQDHLPDGRSCRDIGHGGVERCGRQRAVATRPDHFAAEAEAAVHRANVDELQQHAVGIAVHHAFARRVRGVADRVCALVGRRRQLAQVGEILTRDRVAGLGRVDHGGDVLADADCVARGDARGIGNPGRRDEPSRGQRRRVAERSRHAGSATGAHITSATLQAPVASMTRRSKPSAMPQLAGMIAIAAKKSSSSANRSP